MFWSVRLTPEVLRFIQESREARADQKISELRHQILDLEEQLQASLQRQGGDGEDGGPETGLKNALQRMEKQLEASRESEAQANQELQDRMVAQVLMIGPQLESYSTRACVWPHRYGHVCISSCFCRQNCIGSCRHMHLR